MNYVERVLTIMALLLSSYHLSSLSVMTQQQDIQFVLVFVVLIWAYVMGIISGKRD